MRRFTGYILMLMLITVMGCGGERSRALTPDEDNSAVTEQRNYKDMLARMRAKQSSQQTVAVLEEGIQRFQMEFGRLPTNLTELIARGVLPHVPEPPPGMVMRYDAVHGNISLADQPDGSGIRLPDDVTNSSPLELQQVPLPGAP